MRRPFVAGNWKMHGTRTENADLIEAVLLGLPAQPQADIAVCPPFVYLWEAGRQLKASSVSLGAQSVCAEPIGAFTGEVSAPMLKDVGCRYVIVGHSERRRSFGETDAIVRKKVLAALRRGLRPIVCIGETSSQRAGHQTESVLAAQLPEALTGVDH